MKEHIPFDPQAPQPAGTQGAPPDPVRPGGPCPRCGTGRLDYNGLLELECPACGYVIGGGAGCT